MRLGNVIILNALIKEYENIDILTQSIKDNFTIADLCDILNINRNRYNYLIRTGQIEKYIHKAIEDFKIFLKSKVEG